MSIHIVGAVATKSDGHSPQAELLYERARLLVRALKRVRGKQ
jgi:hypothetical protein